MAFTADQLTEAIAVAHKHIRKDIASQLTTANYLYHCMTTKNKVYVSGGTKIQQPIEYAENQSKGFIDGKFDPLDTNANQQITFAEWDWKYRYSNANITMDDLTKTHETPEAIASLLQSKKRAAVGSAVREFSESLHGTGSNSGGKAFNGLTDIFAASGTSYATLLDTDFAAADTWLTDRDTSSPAPNYTTISKKIAKLKSRAHQYGAGDDGFKLDIAISNHAVQNKFMSTLQAQQRFADSNTLKAGFDGVNVNGVFWYIDEYSAGSADGTTADNYLYLICSNSMKLFYKYGLDKGSPFEQNIQLPNQTVKSDQMFFAGNIGCISRRVNGVFTALVA